MSARSRRLPIVYGTPGQIALLMESLAGLLRQEPDEVFQDPDVREEGTDLASLIVLRLGICVCADGGTPTEGRAAS